MPHWFKLRHLDGFFHGLRSLPKYESRDYTSQYHKVEPCDLDKAKKVPVPDDWAYSGVVQGQAEPVFGSHSLLGLKDDACFDRFGRYGPYGLGYSSEVVLSSVWTQSGLGVKLTAVVVRTYTGFKWTRHAILNFRAMVSELALRSGGEYAVHFLLHVRDNDLLIWADPATAQRVLDDNVLAEFHNLTVLWSEAQMRLLYPGEFGPSFSNPASGNIHGVFRSAHMPLQHFAMSHPEYTHFWNLEMDVRWLGNYYELFDRLGHWAKEQSRVEAWERSAKYYIPRLHGDWRLCLSRSTCARDTW
ncbi:e1c5f314-2b61-45fe-b36f-391cbc984352 [Thermothielavioides terrestris]|uniref:E1c5f314-2b61-45fe-b36f-391cbc984352 n=1 Tax=Thermothielavioides terrestris TaxID=2587410 RepID=A0A446BF01_9PEZI|nr:e1c5f314-2b61-45fe-b36f-391cbc984352 [Thermothielavioides terrestris]